MRPTDEYRRRRRAAWIWPGLLMATLFIASGQSEVVGLGWSNADKVMHALVFGLLATLVARTQLPHRYWFGVVVASGYGLIDELWQTMTPGRSVELADWVADTFGAVLAVVLYSAWPWYRRLLEIKLRPRGKHLDCIPGGGNSTIAPHDTG